MMERKHSVPHSEGPSESRSSNGKDSTKTKLAEMREILAEKENIISSQKHAIKQLEAILESSQKKNASLRKTVYTLTRYITEELNEVVPPLPDLPNEDSPIKVEPVSFQKSHKKPKKSKSIRKSRNKSFELGDPVSNFSSAKKSVASNNQPRRRLAFDEGLSQHLFEDFSGAELLKSILDAQLSREEMEKITKFLLGKGSQETFLFKTRTVLFESLSFFLSLRNIAFLNSIEVFLPRVLEMLVDILEVERVVIYGYDPEENFFYSKAVTAEIPKQVIIEDTMGHVSYAKEKSLFINNAYEDPRFDSKYDQMTDFITRNLACLPLRVGDKLLGILECSNKKGNFGERDMVILEQTARQVSMGFAGIELRENLQDLQQKGELYRGHIERSREALLVPLLSSIVSSLKTQVNCERITIYIHDDQAEELVSILATDIEGVIRIPLNLGIASLCFTTSQVINLDNASDHPQFNSYIDQKTGFQTKQVLCTPVGSKGVLQCLNKNNQVAFSKADESRATGMAEILSKLFESADNLEGLLLSCDFNELCLQAVRQAIIHVNSEGFLQKVNRFAAEMFSLSPEKIVGATVSEIFEHSPELLEKFVKTTHYQTTSTFNEQKLVVARNNKDPKTIKVDASFILIGELGEGSSYLILLTPVS